MARVFNRRGGWSKHINKAYRSGLEETLAKQLETAGIPVEFETVKIKYQKPASMHTYTPDFILPNGIIIESKGLFEAADRQKHLLIKQQYPDLSIRFIFTNPNQKLYKGSPTTYGEWCRKHGFYFAKKFIPPEWIQENPTRKLTIKKKGGTN